MSNYTNIVENILNSYNFNNYPGNYKNALIQVVEKATKTFKDNLLSITLGGSGGKNKIHPGWSDLDIYFVLKDYDTDQVRKFISTKWNEDIHIGTTYYTIDEVNNRVLDNKTKIMLYEKYNYNVNPTIIGEDLFPKIDYNEIKINDFNNLANVLHEVRRTYTEIKNKKRELTNGNIKKLLVLMKCILNNHNNFKYGYEEVFNAFYDLANPSLTKQNGDAIIQIIKDIKSSTYIYLEVCEDIFKFLERDWRK